MGTVVNDELEQQLAEAITVQLLGVKAVEALGGIAVATEHVRPTPRAAVAAMLASGLVTPCEPLLRLADEWRAEDQSPYQGARDYADTFADELQTVVTAFRASIAEG
jgi:hypothetical protein